MLTCTSSAFTNWPVLNFCKSYARSASAFFWFTAAWYCATFDLIIALRLGDFRIGGKLRLLPGLRRLRRSDHRIAVGLGLRDLRVALDLRDARLAERVEITLRVADVANGEADDAQAHVRHVAGGDFLHLRGEGVAVLVNFLDRHRAENRAQMTFERLHGDVLDFVRAPCSEIVPPPCAMEMSSPLTLICATPSTFTGTPLLV